MMAILSGLLVCIRVPLGVADRQCDSRFGRGFAALHSSPLRALAGSSLSVAATLLFTVGLCGFAGAGCQSTTKPPGTRFAAIEIRGNTPGQISNVALEVFEAHGYQAIKIGMDHLVLEKKGTKWNELAYGSWVSDTPVWMRVNVFIDSLSETTCLLKCSAYVVQDRGSSVEEELRVSRFRSEPYQKLLEEVAGRLNPKRAVP